MGSLAVKEQERAIREATLCWHLRNNKGTSVEQIAEKLEYGSVEAMRRQFQNWGLPEWLLEETSGSEGETVQDQEPKKPRSKRKAKTVRGPAQELPPSTEAAPLFKEALDKLRYDLETLTYLQSGARRTPEYLQDGRFTQDTREEVLWADPELGRTRIAGVTQAPGNGLTQLIAAYLVAGGDPEPLIEKLHYSPDKLEREKLGRVLYGDKKNSKPGLLTRAVHAARLIRGADVEAGASAGEFDVDEMTTRHRILGMRAAGLSDQEVVDALSSEGIPISMSRLNWLVGLGMPDPMQ